MERYWVTALIVYVSLNYTKLIQSFNVRVSLISQSWIHFNSFPLDLLQSVFVFSTTRWQGGDAERKRTSKEEDKFNGWRWRRKTEEDEKQEKENGDSDDDTDNTHHNHHHLH